MRFENKVAIVTGACRGIGQAIALAFAAGIFKAFSGCVSDPVYIKVKMNAIGKKFTA